MLDSAVVVTPVMAGVDDPSIAVHVLPSYKRGLSNPLTAYKKLPPGVVMLMYSQRALVRPLTTADPTAPADVAS